MGEIFRTGVGLCCFKNKQGKTCTLSVGNRDRLTRIVRENQPSPIENDNWFIYDDLPSALEGSQFSENPDTTVTVHTSRYGDLRFYKVKACTYAPYALSMKRQDERGVTINVHDFSIPPKMVYRSLGVGEKRAI